MAFLAIIGAVILMAASAPAGITDPSCRGILHGVAKNAGNQPVPGIRLVLWPIGVDLDYVLPTATSNEAGTYSFEHVCAGRFTVLVDDERAGYPPKTWSYLLGYKREAKVTTEHLRIELTVVVPPKAALLEVVARNSRTNAAVPTLRIMLKTSKVKMHDWITIRNDSSEPLLLPANTDLLCRVLAEGYREWHEGKKKGKKVRLPPGSHITLNAQFKKLPSGKRRCC
jgi:hypothetical protein